MSIEGKLYQLEGLHPTSVEKKITSIDHHNYLQIFSESEFDSTYCKTDDDDDVDDAIGYSVYPPLLLPSLTLVVKCKV